MKKTIIAGILSAALLLNAAPAFAEEAVPVVTSARPEGTVSYTDIGGTWFESAAQTYGYPEIFGINDALFFPSQPITRMEFARLLHRALGLRFYYFAPTDISTVFSDVSNEEEGADALYDLVTAGILDRTGTFGKDEMLRRDEMIHLVVNAFKYHTGGQFALIAMMPAPFEDDAEINPDYHGDVVTAVLLKLVNGVGDNFLEPANGATRAQAVTLVSRLVSLAESHSRDGVNVVANAFEKDGGLQMLLTVRNNSDNAVTIRHSSGQKFDFQVLDEAGETLYTWSADKMFPMMLTETVLASGESIEFSDFLPADRYAAFRESAAFVKAFLTGSSDDFEVNAEGYETDIRK